MKYIKKPYKLFETPEYMMTFETFLNENTTHINPRNTNLSDDFDFINDLIFDNKITKPKLLWFKSKNKIGLTTFNYGKGGVKEIKISNYYNITRVQYLGVLAHEMVHAYIEEYNIIDNNSHGRVFKRILNTLNNKQDLFVIYPREDAAYFPVSDKVKKEIGVLLFRVDNDISGIFINKKLINDADALSDFIYNLKEYIRKNPLNIFNRNKSVEIDFYKCDDPELSKFKLKTKLILSGLQFFTITDDILGKIKSGELLKIMKIK